MDAAHPGELFHHGVSGSPEKLRTRACRAFLDTLELADDARERIEIALALIDAIEAQIAPLERELRQLARRQNRLPGADAPLRLAESAGSEAHGQVDEKADDARRRP